MAARQVHQYALTSPAFILSPEDRAAVTIQGAVYSSRWRLLHVFAGDFGHSIFAVPLAERRRRLLAIDWVADASVSRVLPNRLVVRVMERKPVAFASLPARAGARPADLPVLVDAQGVLLDPPPRAQFAFPVLNGLTEDQTEPERRVRVRAMLRLMEDIGPSAQNISEVDVSSPDDLRVVAQVEGRPLELLLGEGNYSRRMQNFLFHYPEIRKHSPNVSTFDLRLDDRITAKERVTP
jgi:cell division protein FtsQ